MIHLDWRSPGLKWVKIDDGWEQLRVLECVKRKRCSSECSNGSSSDLYENDNWDNDETEIPPHCHITLKCTKEIAGFNGLGEAVRRLDFRSSLRDRKRFHYICSLLRLLVASKGIASLPGGAQRLLLQMVEEVAYQVNDSQQNLNILRSLVDQLKELMMVEDQKCWGKPLGSPSLWKNHVQTIQRIERIANEIRIREPGPEVKPKLHDLPEECIREIVLRLADYRDLESSSDAWSLMSELVNEHRVWRELTYFHFTTDQIEHFLDKKQLYDVPQNKRNWKGIFHSLRKQHGLREDLQYAEILSLCRFCRCLFWPSAGHPCIIDQSPDFRARLEQLKEETGGELVESQPVPPSQFLKYFSL